MLGMATLNIRNVPAEVVETLKARAARKGDSLNTEVVRALEEAAGRRTVDEILESIDAIRRDHPAPPWDEFIEDVRRERDERVEHIWREATRPRLDE
jgi:plasmid stability protein